MTLLQFSPLQGRHLASAHLQGEGAAVPHFEVGTEEFKAWSLEREGPAVLGGGLASYDLSHHRLDNLLSTHGDRVVPVEVSSHGADYRDAFQPRQPGRVFQEDVEMPLYHLLNHIKELEKVNTLENVERKCKDTTTLLYLAQKDIRGILPSLALDPTHLPIQEVKDRLFQQSIWLGPRGTTTPLHCDPYCNLLCQVWGRKRVRIYDATERQRLFSYPQGVLRNTSQVSCDAVDTAKFPGFAEVAYLECVVEPGQILFLPKKFWHEVVALTGSLSLSFWWT